MRRPSVLRGVNTAVRPEVPREASLPEVWHILTTPGSVVPRRLLLSTQLDVGLKQVLMYRCLRRLIGASPFRKCRRVQVFYHVFECRVLSKTVGEAALGMFPGGLWLPKGF